MKVCLDARTATPHFPGIGSYVSNLLNALLPEIREPDSLSVLVARGQKLHWDLPPGWETRVRCREAPAPAFSLRQQWVVPRILRELRPDVYHSPYFQMPYRPGVPTAVTIYDLIPELHPGHYSRRVVALFRLLTRLALKSARRVIAISETTRQDLLRRYRLPAEKSVVIPLAAHARFRPQARQAEAAVRRKYDLPQRYALHVGANKPHKNHRCLLSAWAALRDTRAGAGADIGLVLAGPWSPRYDMPQERVQQLGLGPSVRLLGEVPVEDLPPLYSAAQCLVFPSLYEGFGLPVVEAMACGTAVLHADLSCLNEITGGAGLRFDPTRALDIKVALERILEDGKLREELRDSGLLRAREFTWRATAERTLRVYREVGV